ncbi:MAG: FRG domain-containing protein [Verrucomicrobia bacterium]|nr:FRG domain-containing protein [Verrucomicrobiota bacterium]
MIEKLMTTKTATDLNQFHSLLVEARQTLLERDHDELWYRGHDRGPFPLIPKLFRHEDPEARETAIFQICDQYVEQKVYGSDPWSQISWMQHYGIPTRLLDWTTEAQIALSFAVQFLKSRNGEEDLRGRAPHEMPCVYVLNASRLNRMCETDKPVNEVPVVAAAKEPEHRPEPKYEFRRIFTKDAEKPRVYPLAVAPRPADINKRQIAQRGRFTVQGSNLDPLEIQAPNCIFCIQFSAKLCECLRQVTFIPFDALRLYPDETGIAQFVASEARLRLLPYDPVLARKIRKRLKETHAPDKDRIAGQPRYHSLFGTCNFGDPYIKRPKKAAELLRALTKQGGGHLFLSPVRLELEKPILYWRPSLTTRSTQTRTCLFSLSG